MIGILLTGALVGRSDARADAPNNPKTAALVSKNVFIDAPQNSRAVKLKVRFANNDSKCRSRNLPPLIQFSVLCSVCHILSSGNYGRIAPIPPALLKNNHAAPTRGQYLAGILRDRQHGYCPKGDVVSRVKLRYTNIGR